jgi:carboxylesterase
VPVLPGAELLCHGFTGCPQSLRPWAEHLARAGHTVRLPLLPGHGTTWQQLASTRWEDWYAAVEEALEQLRPRCDLVVVGGLSMGGALALRLAQCHGDAVAGLVLVNPAVASNDRRRFALPVLRHVLTSVAGMAGDIRRPGVIESAYTRMPVGALHSLTQGWRQVITDLPTVRRPVLLFRSVDDHVVPASSSALILERISSTDVEEVLCERSHHVATLDEDAQLIFEGSADFVARLAAGVSGPATGGPR